jgi:hypothetical protein
MVLTTTADVELAYLVFCDLLFVSCVVQLGNLIRLWFVT